MTETNGMTPLEPGVELGVRCLVQGILHGKWDQLTKEFGLPKAELEQIGNQFHDRQQAHNSWRWLKAQQFEAAGDRAKAADWRQARCMLCGEVMLAGTQNICHCYRNYRIGYIQYNPVDPLLHLQNWTQLGGVWSQGNRPAGTAEARAYANRPCYSDECTVCDRTFFVTISEILKVSTALIEDSEAGGDGRYKFRRTCADCRREQRNEHQQQRGPTRSQVRQLRPASPGPSAQPHVGGERGAKR